jgi:N-acetyl-alpha-D-muramate 1-phosphate uridylyltransferase
LPEAHSELPVAILAGGLATRLRPITERIPKSLVTVAGEPFLAHQLRLLHQHGLRKIVLCVGHLAEMIEQQFGHGEAFGMDLAYSHDGPELIGTGGAIRKALPLLGDAFYVLYGDSYLPMDYRAAAVAFRANGKPGLMTIFRNEGEWDTSNVEFTDGQIFRYDKEHRTRSMRHIDYGLSLFRQDVFEKHPAGARFDLSTVQRDLACHGELAGYEVAERFYEIGSPSGLAELDALLRPT